MNFENFEKRLSELEKTYCTNSFKGRYVKFCSNLFAMVARTIEILLAPLTEHWIGIS